ncbi:hypothetical protein AMTRI_Chr01g137170 [Amborella trichopoda]
MRGHDLINTILPDELLIEIFHHLDGQKESRDACSLVCKRWSRLESMSRETIRIGASGIPDWCISLLVKRFTGLRSVFIDERLPVCLQFQTGFSHRGNGLVGRISRHFKPRITRGSSDVLSLLSTLHYAPENSGSEEAELELCSLSDAGLTALARGSARLEKLSLIWCNAVTSQGLKSIAENCRALRALDLQGCYVGDQGLAAVGECCKQLEDLNLRFCEGLTDTGLTNLVAGCGQTLKSLGVATCARISDISLEAVGAYCTSLESLSLDSEFIKTSGVLAVAQGCQSLKSLRLQCINVTDEALQAVGAYCLSLEVLALSSFQKFTDRSLCAIGKGCKNLNVLTLTDCYFLSDKSLAAIAVGCTELTHLEINGCHNIGTSGLEAIGRSCQGLSELVLMYCQKIGDNALLEIGRGCKLLQALHLVDCSSIGDAAICNIAQGCKNLKKLHVRRCYEVLTFVYHGLTRVGDEALIAIGRGCSLRYLNVSGCHRIGDAGVMAIAKGCPELVYLDVSVCRNVGDMALAELGEGCPLLKDIVLSHCRKISDIGLGHLVKRCTRLESCHMVYCPSVTAAGVATVVSSCLSIKKVVVEKWKVSQRTRRRAASVLADVCLEL